MNCFIFRLSLATWALLMGVFLPYIDFGKFDHFINFFWSVLYGLGLLLCEMIWEMTLDGERRLVILIGGLLWPLFVTGLIFWLAGKFWNRVGSSKRLACLILVFITGFAVVGFDPSARPPLDYLPTYWKLMYIAW